MNDRELLELAAKAAGIPRSKWDYDELRRLGHNVTREMMWNPLTDDGDALRLAVKLKLDISVGVVESTASGTTADRMHYAMEFYSEHAGSPYAATRRAIVRAAAEIGKHIADTVPDEVR